MRSLEDKRRHMQWVPIDGWVNGRHPSLALRLELEHELGERVEEAMENEELGFGPLFDLQYSLFMASYDEHLEEVRQYYGRFLGAE